MDLVTRGNYNQRKSMTWWDAKKIIVIDIICFTFFLSVGIIAGRLRQTSQIKGS